MATERRSTRKGRGRQGFPCIICPGLKGIPHTVAPDDGREYRTLLYEDFSRMTAGTDSTPDYSLLLNNSTGTILPEYTEIPGWGGSGIRSAGGNVCVDWWNTRPQTAPTNTGVHHHSAARPEQGRRDHIPQFPSRSIDTAPGNLYITWTYPYEEGAGFLRSSMTAG